MDRCLAVLLAGAMLGPWHTANRLSRLIAVTGACPERWLTTRVLVGGIPARTALRDEHYGVILATITDSESDAIDPPAW